MVHEYLLQTEQDIVGEAANAVECTCSTLSGKYVPFLTDKEGNIIGYTWNYRDPIKIVINVNETLLRVRDNTVPALALFLKGKTLRITLTNNLGEEVYTQDEDAKIITNFKLRTREIKANSYRAYITLIGEENDVRIQLLNKPYIIYVK